MFLAPLFSFQAATRIFLNEEIRTFYVLSLDCLDSDIRVVLLVVTLIDITVLSRSDLSLKDVVVNDFRHLSKL